MCTIVYCSLIFGFISFKDSKIKCSGLNITITNYNNVKFVNKQDVKNSIKRLYRNIIKTNIEDINLNKIEEKLKQNKYIDKVEAYITNNNRVNIIISQNIPKYRILIKNKGSYITKDTIRLPLSRKYTSRVLFVSGNFHLKQFDKIHEFSMFITNNKFWNSQIEHVYFKNNKEIILIPKVGKHKIIFGNLENYKAKFEKLFALYKNGLNKVGWDKYKEINLVYKNQIVCTKK